MSLGSALDTLLEDVAARKGADPATSWTARLLNNGTAACAKKVGEEGVELAIALVGQGDEEVASEAADLLFHLAVALTARGVSPQAVADALTARRGTSGLEEKARRPA